MCVCVGGGGGLLKTVLMKSSMYFKESHMDLSLEGSNCCCGGGGGLYRHF